MPVTQTHIEQLLQALKSILDQIAPLRQQAADLETELAQVQLDYDQELGDLNAEAARLEALKILLRAHLAQREVAPIVQAPLPVPDPTPPPVVADSPVVLGDTPLSPPPEDPRAARKRALADHIEYFLADSDREIVMQLINAVLIDDRRDIADMLESLAWGPIWMARADWETLEDHHSRLEGWRQALADRLTYWQNEVRRLKSDQRHGLLLERKSRTPEEWQAYLDQMALEQQAEIDNLTHEVAVLEQQWQAKTTTDTAAAESGVTNA